MKGATALKNVRDVTTLGDLGYHGFRRREGYHSLGKARGMTALGDIRVSWPWEMKDITTLGNVRGIMVFSRGHMAWFFLDGCMACMAFCGFTWLGMALRFQCRILG